MTQRFKPGLVPLFLAASLLVGPLPALRASGPPRGVSDEAGMFSPEAREKAEAIIADIHRKHGKDLFIQTFAKAPPSIKDVDLDNAKQKRAYFAQWANRNAKNDRVNGVYVLICKSPAYIITSEGQKTRTKAFTDNNLIELGDRMYKDLKARKFDQALVDGAKYVQETMDKNLASTRTSEKRDNSMNISILGWVCIGLAGLAILWVIVGVIRSITAPRGGYGGGPGYGGGGPGYGGGGPGYGGGGGGGGFLSGLLGGMFGGIAGSWLYGNMFGGHNAGGFGSSNTGNPGAPGGTDASPTSDVGGDYTAGGGGDFDDQGGGDAGGGGGDWGGGDAGGGGGGDWGGGDAGGGGGGGDWGGGGGDFGGGGGGDF